MNKILLILKREYLTRVKKKTFILSTILFPLLYLGVIFGLSYFGEKARANLHVAVIDSSGYFDKGRIERSNLTDSSTRLSLVNSSRENISKEFRDLGYDGFIVIPQQVDWEKGLKNISFNTDKKYGIASVNNIQNKLNDIWSEVKNEKLGIDDYKKSVITESRISVRQSDLKDKAANEEIASTIGMVS